MSRFGSLKDKEQLTVFWSHGYCGIVKRLLFSQKMQTDAHFILLIHSYEHLLPISCAASAHVRVLYNFVWRRIEELHG